MNRFYDQLVQMEQRAKDIRGYDTARKNLATLTATAQDRKTGEMYDPKEAFDKMMNKPEIQAVFKRLSVR